MSAKGAASYQPGATPQENAPKHAKGLKARPISRADDESGLQPSDVSPNREPGALPQATMVRAVGAEMTCDPSGSTVLTAGGRLPTGAPSLGA